VLTSYAIAVLSLLVLDIVLNLATYLRPYMLVDHGRELKWGLAVMLLVSASCGATVNLLMEASVAGDFAQYMVFVVMLAYGVCGLWKVLFGGGGN